MFKFLLKLILASAIGAFWYYIDRNGITAVAISLFLFVFFVLIVKPIEFQPPKKREEYIQKMREKKEKLMMIETKHKEELERAKKLSRLKREQAMEYYRESYQSKFKE